MDPWDPQWPYEGRGSLNKKYCHNNTKMLFAFPTGVTFAGIMQNNSASNHSILAQIKAVASS